MARAGKSPAHCTTAPHRPSRFLNTGLPGHRRFRPRDPPAPSNTTRTRERNSAFAAACGASQSLSIPGIRSARPCIPHGCRHTDKGSGACPAWACVTTSDSSPDRDRAAWPVHLSCRSPIASLFGCLLRNRPADPPCAPRQPRADLRRRLHRLTSSSPPNGANPMIPSWPTPFAAYSGWRSRLSCAMLPGDRASPPGAQRVNERRYVTCHLRRRRIS